MDPVSVLASKRPLRTFIEEFVRETKKSNGQKYCFVLGAGASRDSGIKMAGELAMGWLRQIHHERGIAVPFEAWIEDPAEIAPDNPEMFKDFAPERAADFYFQIYDLYCVGDPQKGYEALNKEIDGKEPSFGYSVIANILAETPNKVVITVNFDNLIADSLFTFSDKTPLVCAHETLAGFVPIVAERPVVAKIHRDRFYGPKSGLDEVSVLEEAWKRALRDLFRIYKPIFIGYGSNDHSLMSFLKEEENLMPRGYFWLLYDPSIEDSKATPATLPDHIEDLLESRAGNWVPSPGFDGLMILLHHELEYKYMHEDLIRRAEERKNGRKPMSTAWWNFIENTPLKFPTHPMPWPFAMRWPT